MATLPAYDRSSAEESQRRTRHAWASYNASLRDLEGREYEEAEAQAWDRLQRRLAEIQRPSR